MELPSLPALEEPPYPINGLQAHQVLNEYQNDAIARTGHLAQVRTDYAGAGNAQKKSVNYLKKAPMKKEILRIFTQLVAARQK